MIEGLEIAAVAAAWWLYGYSCGRNDERKRRPVMKWAHLTWPTSKLHPSLIANTLKTEHAEALKTGRPDYCCGKCPELKRGGYDCTCRNNPRCKKGAT